MEDCLNYHKVMEQFIPENSKRNELLEEKVKKLVWEDYLKIINKEDNK